MTSAVQSVSARNRAGADGAMALPPVVLLGGEANALSAARSLGRRGIRVYAISEPGGCIRHSRYCRPVILPDEGPFEETCAKFLLGRESDYLSGAVLLAFSDAAIQALCQNRDQLLKKYKLDESAPAAQMAMLNKVSTYQAARAAGVPTPAFWVVQSRSQVISLRNELVFPLIVKPVLAHKAKKSFGQKHERVANFDELLRVLDAEHAAGLDVLLMELIPGGDDCLCSYYTYLDESCAALFDFTKRIIRRFPVGMGPACYHITDWVPDIIEHGRRLFRHVGLRGLANVEFKKDPRDGQYKLIECNARFTAANCLVAASGFDLSEFVYNRIVGLPQTPLVNFKRGLRLWDPALDVMSFLALRRRGELTAGRWIAGLLHRQTFAYFAWTDPLPALARGRKLLKLSIKRWRQMAAGGAVPRVAASESQTSRSAQPTEPRPV
jgi:predicted ATP-grasp superfamily ATP-dependent carboligase